MDSSDDGTALFKDENVIHAANRRDTPSLRLLHYNDVYHIDCSSSDPVGGIARFQTLCDYYRNDGAFRGQPGLLTLFSGDAFNPSLESAVTKGSHMVPVLNGVNTDCACLGNHDLDFGVPQFRLLASQCRFPWLAANVLDPDLGEDVPLGNAQKTAMLTASNGIKLGIIGLVEREWLDTINSLPPNVIYRSATITAQELAPRLREQGADIIIALTHAREPNDNKLAEKTPPGVIDLILGGHDHFYGHSFINGTHVLRSGTDFKQLSYIKAWRKLDGTPGWDFEIIRRDVVRSLPEDPNAAALVGKISSGLQVKMDRPIGYTAAPLDARFTTVRLRESNIGNFVCDLMRLYYQADCTIMASGTIRGDQVYPPGVLRAKDMMTCFPFEDPCVVLKITGKAVWDALENGVCLYPALEGRFPQVANIRFAFDPKAPPGSRVKTVEIGDEPVDLRKKYTVATRDYMARGKDGFTSLLPPPSGTAEELVSDEHGILISMLLRQYFLSLRVLGRWRSGGGRSNGSSANAPSLQRHFERNVHRDLHETHPIKEPKPSPSAAAEEDEEDSDTGSMDAGEREGEVSNDGSGWIFGDADADADGGGGGGGEKSSKGSARRERELGVMRRVMRKWWRVTGLPGHPGLVAGGEGEEFGVSWTKGIMPRVEGRIVVL